MQFPTQAERCLAELQSAREAGKVVDLAKFSKDNFDAEYVKAGKERLYFFPDDSRITSHGRGCSQVTRAHLP